MNITNCLLFFQSQNKLSPFVSITEQIVYICFNHRKNCLHVFQSQNKWSPFVSITEQIVSICFNHRTNCLHLLQSQKKLSPSVPITEQIVSFRSNRRTTTPKLSSYRFRATLTDEEASSQPKIEKKFREFCKAVKSNENRFCYYLGGTEDAATGTLRFCRRFKVKLLKHKKGQKYW